jgi:hypothetical protein
LAKILKSTAGIGIAGIESEGTLELGACFREVSELAIKKAQAGKDG